MNKLYFFLIITGCENEKDCENQCNGHCSNNLPCNSSNGLCSNGCAPGYVGTFCNNSMYTINISIGLSTFLKEEMVVGPILAASQK